MYDYDSVDKKEVSNKYETHGPVLLNPNPNKDKIKARQTENRSNNRSYKQNINAGI